MRFSGIHYQDNYSKQMVITNCRVLVAHEGEETTRGIAASSDG